MTEESKKRHEKLHEKSSNDENEIQRGNEPNCLAKCFNNQNLNEPEFKGWFDFFIKNVRWNVHGRISSVVVKFESLNFKSKC